MTGVRMVIKLMVVARDDIVSGVMMYRMIDSGDLAMM